MKKAAARFTAILISLVILSYLCLTAVADTVIDTILTVGTTQAFTDEPVSDEDLAAILQAGLAATSAINQQPWFFVAVTNPDIMSDISASGGFTLPAGAFPPLGGPQGAPEGAPEGAPAPAMPAGSGSAKAAMGDSPLAIIIYMDENTKSPNASFDCGLAAQNMYLAAASLGYGVKIVSSPTMSLNGANHDALCEKLGVDPSMQALAVLLIGKTDTDAVSAASVRSDTDSKTSIIK